MIPNDGAEETLRLELEEVRCAGLRPPPRIALPEWADTFRRLSASTSAIAGKWRTESVEVARGPMMAVKALLAADLEDDITATASANLDTCQVLDAERLIQDVHCRDRNTGRRFEKESARSSRNEDQGLLQVRTGAGASMSRRSGLATRQTSSAGSQTHSAVSIHRAMGCAIGKKVTDPGTLRSRPPM